VNHRFYQLSKVITSPMIVLLTRVRTGARLSRARMLCLACVNVGVALATVTDVDVGLRGIAVAALNIVVAAYAKVDYGALCKVGFRNDVAQKDLVA
jgi:hypothetical protein